MSHTIEYKEYLELKAIGIYTTIKQGRDAFDNPVVTIICNDNTQWDYIPEDGIYEQRVNDLFHIKL